MKQMCAQLEILKKIREKGAMNGFAIDLAEAQASDYIHLNKKVTKIEKDVNGIKKDLSSVKTEQAVQGGKLDLIIQRLNSPVEKERLDGQKWNLLTSVAKHKGAWVIVIVVLISFILAGDKLVKILERLI